MGRHSSLRVYCDNEECGQETVAHNGYTPTIVWNYRRMEFAGSRRIGFWVFVFKILSNSDDNIEMGTYYAYMCPVCGAQVLVLDKGGILARVNATLHN